MLTIIAFYALMAGVFTVGKQVALYAHPFFLTGLRLPIAGSIFLLYTRYYEKNSFNKITKPVALLMVAYGFFSLCMDSGRFYALQTLPAANTALVTSLAPFTAAFLSYFFLNEKMTVKKIIILCVGFLGMLPLFVSHLNSSTTVSGSSNLFMAYGSACLSMLGFVVIGLFLKILTGKYKVPLFMAIGGGMLMGGLMGLGCSLLFDPWNPLPFINTSKALPIIAYLLVTHNLMAYPLYGYLLEHYPLTLVAFAQLLTPLFTAILRWFWFGETISLPFMISFAVLGGALYLFYKEEEKEGLIT
jgi:drug/metabolite transporter (DMT)-like permease